MSGAREPGYGVPGAALMTSSPAPRAPQSACDTGSAAQGHPQSQFLVH